MNRVNTWIVCVVAALVASAPARLAVALVVSPPASNDNINSPGVNPGWLNVGNRGVYLGNRWVLTAFHRGANTINFQGVGNFTHIPGSEVRIKDPLDPTGMAFTDLLLYRLSSDPGLPRLSIAAATPPVNGTVTLISGGGFALTSNPPTPETHWQVDPHPTLANRFVWTEVPSGGDADGYKTTTVRKLWGTNVVENDGQGDDHTFVTRTSIANGYVISFFTDFDDPDSLGSPGGATASEAQGQPGDSGSAAFYKNGSSWELAGMTHAIFAYLDQPGNTAVYGNLTVMADLASYRTQINAITGIPETGGAMLLSVAAAAALVSWRCSRTRRGAVAAV